ncbi:cupin [Pseudonocardia sp. CNS-139]|nr:cupin [Pseudonocardia sp. CNS-139]
MDHRLVRDIERALDWTGPALLGTEFAIGPLPDAGLCDRLLGPAALLEIIARRSLHYPQLRCLQGGGDLHPRDYLSVTTSSRGHRISMADMPNIGRLLRTGCTLVLDDLGPLDATMEVACRALSWWAGEIARVNVYLTTQDAGGWGIHWDSHDVLCVQLAGEKSWEVRGPSRTAPMDRDAVPNTRPSTDVVWSGTMRAGDVMHIPRGWWHQATRTGSGAGFSLHATFGITRRTGVDWLSWIADQARADSRFRRDLDECTGHHELAAAASMVLSSRGPSEYLTTRRREHTTGRHPTSPGLFGPPETVVCVTDFRPELDVHDGSLVVQAAGRRITAPAGVLPALRPLLSGHPVGLRDLSARTGVDVTALAEVLISAGVCAETTPALAAGYAGMVSATEEPTP